MPYRAVVFVSGLSLLVTLSCNSLSDVSGGSRSDIITIANKISSLPAGQSYTFDVVEAHGLNGFRVKLNGPGTLVPSGESVMYIAPPTVPSPASVEVVVIANNAGGVSDSDTFSITAAAGPVVSISPGAFSVLTGGPPVTLHIAVTQDSAADALTVSMPHCAGGCGSFGAISGTPGSGAYTVQYVPPAWPPMDAPQEIDVTSSLADATQGLGFVTIASPWDY